MGDFMALTLAQLKAHTVHVEPGGPSTALPPGTLDDVKEQIINEAGRMLYQAWPWKFRERPPKRLNFTAPISIADGTWTESSKTLTKTGGFTSYTFAVGDEIEITDGTGATVGHYPIASRTSNDAIVLVDSIGSAADGLTDIDGTISFPYCALPSDFGECILIRADGLTVDFQLVDFATIAQYRDDAILPVGFMYFGAITQPGQVAQTSAFGLPRLELYPAPASTQVGALTLWYRAGWRELTEDTHYAAVPLHIERLLIEYIRQNCEGYSNQYGESGGVVSIHDRLAEIEASPMFKRATEQDALLQPSYGVMSGGLIGSMTSSEPSVVRTQDYHEVATPFIT